MKGPKRKIKKSQLVIGGTIGGSVLLAFAGGVLCGYKKAAKTPPASTLEPRSQTDESKPVEIIKEVVKEVKVVEPINFDMTYEGVIEIAPSGDVEYDSLMAQAADLFMRIEEDVYEESERMPLFVDTAYTMLSGIICNANSMADSDKQDKMCELADKALDAYHAELKNKDGKTSCLSAEIVLAKYREDLRELCEKLIEYEDNKK